VNKSNRKYVKGEVNLSQTSIGEHALVPKIGVEPTLPCGKRILSPKLAVPSRPTMFVYICF